MGNASTAPSKPKPSAPDDIVELMPPKELGFSGTQKFHRREHAETIALLQSKGYVVVPKDDAA